MSVINQQRLAILFTSHWVCEVSLWVGAPFCVHLCLCVCVCWFSSWLHDTNKQVTKMCHSTDGLKEEMKAWYLWDQPEGEKEIHGILQSAQRDMGTTLLQHFVIKCRVMPCFFYCCLQEWPRAETWFCCIMSSFSPSYWFIVQSGHLHQGLNQLMIMYIFIWWGSAYMMLLSSSSRHTQPLMTMQWKKLVTQIKMLIQEG